MKVNLKLTGKRGPFELRKLTFTEAQDLVFNPDGKSEADLSLRLVQMTLVNGTGKPIYKPNQLAKMEADIGGVKLLELASRAMQENDFAGLRAFGETVASAEKN